MKTKTKTKTETKKLTVIQSKFLDIIEKCPVVNLQDIPFKSNNQPKDINLLKSNIETLEKMFPNGVIIKKNKKMKDDNYIIYFYYKGHIYVKTITHPSDLQIEVGKGYILTTALFLKSGYEFAEFEDYALCETAIPKGNITIAKFLISKGIGPDTLACIYAALEYKRFHILKLLLENGAKINSNDTNIHWIVIDAGIKFLKLLIEHGFDINVSRGLNNILITAVLKNDLDIVKFLVSKGSELKNIKRALKEANTAGHTEIEKFLKNVIKT